MEKFPMIIDFACTNYVVASSPVSLTEPHNVFKLHHSRCESYDNRDDRLYIQRSNLVRNFITFRHQCQ